MNLYSCLVQHKKLLHVPYLKMFLVTTASINKKFHMNHLFIFHGWIFRKKCNKL